ncbi:hypothetical protein VPH35_094316 [Triticum aestivum]|uniref:uncharacterized protein n=1 Tax=Triticum aestivum TaxID=4565 RepID=UPI001D016FA9|nr:uncharacterized protein LOC123114306 [Triticum aestivum]
MEASDGARCGGITETFGTVEERLLRLEVVVLASALVLSSLVLYGSTQRRSSDRVLRGVMWIAYSLSYVVVTYAVGIIQEGPFHGQTFVLWASALLLIQASAYAAPVHSRRDVDQRKKLLLQHALQTALVLWLILKAIGANTSYRAAIWAFWSLSVLKTVAKIVEMVRSSLPDPSVKRRVHGRRAVPRRRPAAGRPQDHEGVQVPLPRRGGHSASTAVEPPISSFPGQDTDDDDDQLDADEDDELDPDGDDELRLPQGEGGRHDRSIPVNRSSRIQRRREGRGQGLLPGLLVVQAQPDHRAGEAGQDEVQRHGRACFPRSSTRSWCGTWSPLVSTGLAVPQARGSLPAGDAAGPKQQRRADLRHGGAAGAGPARRLPDNAGHTCPTRGDTEQGGELPGGRQPVRESRQHQHCREGCAARRADLGVRARRRAAVEGAGGVLGRIHSVPPSVGQRGHPRRSAPAASS